MRIKDSTCDDDDDDDDNDDNNMKMWQCYEMKEYTHIEKLRQIGQVQ